MIEKLEKLDSGISIPAKLAPIVSDLKSLVKGRWSDMLPQSRKGVESAIASLEAALQAERSASARKFVNEAAKGQLAPRPPIRIIVHED